MSNQPTLSYPDWKAPSEDGRSLIWPEPVKLIADTRANQERLGGADQILIQNKPLAELRRVCRQWIGHDDAMPLIATGHQTELHHPGVWAKNPLMDVVAQHVGGQAYHLAVDTDAPKHLSLRWPGQSLPLTDDPAVGTAAWSALLAPPSAGWQEKLGSAAREDRALSYGPMLFDFLDAMKGFSAAGHDFDSSLSESMYAIDQKLGLGHRTLMASALWQSPAYLTFVHYIISHASTFIANYNNALADYRRRTGTTSTMRPMPNLFVGPEALEVPFWLDDLASGSRSRPSVFADGEGYRLTLLNGDEFKFDPGAPAEKAATELTAFLVRAKHRLSPRALTLTMFVRLLLADQFVHGIGGGRYDQVTDQIIAKHFGIEPPAFSVTTATLYYPGAAGRERVCMPCILRDGHRLKHAAMGPAKRERVAAIAALPRRSAARSQAFLQMQSDLRAAVLEDTAIKNWEKYAAESHVRLQEEKTIFDRELFYAIQPRDRLEGLISQYREAFQLVA